jgi:alpha-glucosidase
LSGALADQPVDGQPTHSQRAVAWWRQAVVYHVYLPSFRDSDGDGVGDLAGLIERLPYLQEVLGVDALWISPFFVSPWVDGGYDIADHTAVDPRFGTLSTFDWLLAEAHRRDLRVIIDYIPNHTSIEHSWFEEARSSRESPKRNWYVWADARPGGYLPNNWLSEGGGSVWTWDKRACQFYLHSHLIEQPDLNWRNPELRDAMLGVLRYWLDRGVDGVRIDVAHMLMKDPELHDNPPDPAGRQNPYDRQHPDFHTQLHVHDRRHPDVHLALREIREVLDEYEDRVAIGELDVMPWAEWAAYFGRDLDELHLPLNFKLVETPWDASEVGVVLTDLEIALPPGAWPVNNLGNHDRSRIASRYGEANARVAAMLLLTARGTALLYYGDELGMTDVEIPAERLRDGYARLEGGPTRDPNRTPMPWSDAPNGGFGPTDAEPWLPLGPDWRRQNVERQLGDHHSMLRLYRRLLALRRARPALRTGTLDVLPSPAPDCLLYERRLDAERLTVALNFADKPRPLRLPRAPALILLSTKVGGCGAATQDLVLGPNEGVVLVLPEATGARPA